MKSTVPGPTYAEMLHAPQLRSNAARQRVGPHQPVQHHVARAGPADPPRRAAQGTHRRPGQHRGAGGPAFPVGQPQGGPGLHHADGRRTGRRDLARRAHRDRSLHRQLRHRHGLRFASQGLPGHRDHAGADEQGALRAHPAVRRRTGPDARVGERRHPGPGAHRALQEGSEEQGPGAVRAAAQLPLPPLRDGPQRAGSGAGLRQRPGGGVRFRARFGGHARGRRRDQGAVSRACGLRARAEGVLHAVQQRPGHAPHRRHRRQDGDADPQRPDHRLRDA